MASLLEVREFVVQFGDAFRVGPVSLRLGSGALYLDGPNGSGKSTLMRALAGELVPSQGAVEVCGLDVHQSAEGRRHISLVPSAPELPGFLSVAEAIEFTVSLRRARDWIATRYLEELDLDPGLPLASASAGQRQKAELVCALAGDPAVLLLDETFTHLDRKSAEVLARWIMQWSKTRLVVFTHHGDPPVSPDAVIRIEHGNVELQGPFERDGVK